MEGVGRHSQFVVCGKERVLYLDLFFLSVHVVDQSPDDSDLWALCYWRVGHKVHSQRNHVHGDGHHEAGVHGEGDHEDAVHEGGVHVDGVHEGGVHVDDVQGKNPQYNCDYEGVYRSSCYQEGDGQGAVLVRLSHPFLLVEVGIQIHQGYDDDP